MNEKKWIPLPVEFKGIWYSPTYGGFEVYLRDRFNLSHPPDRLNEALKKDKSLKFQREDHQYAEPTWLSKEELEKELGKIEAILVNEETWFSDNYQTPDKDDMLIFTVDYVVTMNEYDGNEYFIVLPRDYKKLLR